MTAPQGSATVHPMAVRVAALVTMVLEVEAGLRPLRHLRPFMAPDLQQSLRLSPTRGPRPQVGRVRVQQRGDRCEAVALLREASGRVTAMALALVRDAQGWLVTDLARPGQATTTPPDARIALSALAWDRAHRPTPHLQAVPPEGPSWQVPAGWARPEVA